MVQLEQGRISGSELVYLIVAYIIGASVILIPGRAAGQDVWIAIIIGAIEGTIIAFIFTTLARRFPGKSIVNILETVFGVYFGKIIGLIFIWYLFHLGSLVIRTFTDFFTTVIMPETPSAVFAITLVLVSAFAVGNGLEVIARCGLVLVPLTVFLFIIIIILQLNQLDFKNFLPVLETPLGQLLKISHSVAVFPFGETVAFLMIFPFLSQTMTGQSKMMGGILWAALFISLVVIQNVGALGATGNIFSYPSFEAVKLINLPFVNTRLEIIITLNFLTMVFIKIALLHYGVVLGLGQIFKLRTFRPLIIPSGILMIFLSIINFNGSIENFKFIEACYPVYAIPFQLGIPLLTLIAALIRKLPRQGAG